MLEFQLVDHPAINPKHCAICPNTAGPLVDTFSVSNESGQEARIYVCARCVKLAARTLGLVKGERMDELLKAGDLLDVARVAADDREKMIQSQIAELAARARKIEALEELLQQERDAARTRQAQLETISETSRALLASAVG